jgi:hypothetical protein
VRTDIVPEDMGLQEVIGHLSLRDARVMKKMITAMVDFNVSLPTAFANIDSLWRTKGYYDAAQFEGFEEALDEWLELGHRYG